MKKYTKIDFDPFRRPEVPMDNGWYLFESKRERWRIYIFTKNNHQFMLQYGTEHIESIDSKEFYRCFMTKDRFGDSCWEYSYGQHITEKEDNDFQDFYLKKTTKLGQLL